MKYISQVIAILICVMLLSVTVAAQDATAIAGTVYAGTPGLDETAPTPDLGNFPTSELAVAPEVTPPFTITIEAPDTTNTDSERYYALLDRLTVLFLALIGVAGAVNGTSLWRIVGFGIKGAELLAFLTPGKQDDIEIAKWRAAYDEKMAAQAAAEGVRAEIEREKADLRANASAKDVNKNGIG